MATRSTNEARKYSNLGQFAEVPMVASDIIYEGSLVGTASGIARPLVAGDPFAGFCSKKADNSAGAASDIRVKVYRRGDVEMDEVGVSSAASNGALVYASDDDTLTLTVGTNTKIGRVIEWISGTKCRVYFEEYFSDV